MNHVAVHMQKLNSVHKTRWHVKHNVRDISPKNVDASRTEENYDLIPDRNTYEQVSTAIEERLEQVKKTIRKDAVRVAEFYITGSPEQMKEMGFEGNKQYFQDSLKHIQKLMGKENVVSAHVHLDEKTPHMHILATPVTKDGRLNMKDFINGNKALYQLQDAFGKIGKKYGLNRGIHKSKAKHTELDEYGKMVNKALTAPEKSLGESMKKYQDRVVKPLQAKNMELILKYKQGLKYERVMEELDLQNIGSEERNEIIGLRIQQEEAALKKAPELAAKIHKENVEAIEKDPYYQAKQERIRLARERQQQREAERKAKDQKWEKVKESFAQSRKNDRGHDIGGHGW